MRNGRGGAGAVFVDAVFVDTVFVDAVFVDAIFVDAIFVDAIFVDAVFVDDAIDFARLTCANLNNRLALKATVSLLPNAFDSWMGDACPTRDAFEATNDGVVQLFGELASTETGTKGVHKGLSCSVA